ncbi:hypothetical protein [Brevibacillus massiliensis]|jgi:hypothetical protein|uniref:hypothetical protein n=2 Tax=Brevibacillus massiliensis TaxID=1118054 RepID=UPI0002EC57FF|nr:hypothetical protein [Brevibacillus massiliensis]
MFLFGAIAGASMFQFLYAERLENLMKANELLSLHNEQLLQDIEILRNTNKAERKKRELVIEEIEATVEEPKPNAFIEAALIRKLKSDLAPLKGKKVEQFSDMHVILHELLERREYVIDGKVVEVKLRSVIISRILQLFVTVRVKNENP